MIWRRDGDILSRGIFFFFFLFFQEMICLCQEFSLGKSPNAAFPLAEAGAWPKPSPGSAAPLSAGTGQGRGASSPAGMGTARGTATPGCTQDSTCRCPEGDGGRKAGLGAGAGRRGSTKPAAVRQKFLETDAANSELRRQLWSLGSAGSSLCSLWINVLLLHYSLSFKGLPGNLSPPSIE